MKWIACFKTKGVCPGSHGTKDQLMIDKMVGLDCKTRRKNLAVYWINFQKAYDSVPHTWIREVLKLYNFHLVIQSVLTNSISKWKTDLTIDGEFMTSINIQCGIFQGDYLSPLLFCLAMNPLSELHAIANTRYGYSVKSKCKIQHLFYMDDLKLFARMKRI